MNKITSLAHASAGASAAMLEEEGRTALDATQPELTISHIPARDVAGQFRKHDHRLA
jgi:hypothetical protein